jgi:DNA processing protein
VSNAWESSHVKPGSTRRSAGPRYKPPSEWKAIGGAEVGFSNGVLLKFPQLWVAGDLSLLEKPSVAIVGSRKATADGRKRTAQLARELVKHGVVVMSGLAEGIDEAAHLAAIEHGGKTIAVIGTPLEKAYPAKHAALQESIYRSHLLISPFAPGTVTYPSHFPERNRVMARLSRATVIIEAGETSGSLHQAVECEKATRSLFIADSIFGKFEWPQRFPTAQRLTDPQQVIADICG